MLNIIAGNMAADIATVPLPGHVPTPDLFRGAVTMNPDKCIGCGMCSYVCVCNAITGADHGKEYAWVYDPGRCTFCGRCQECCPVQAISMDPNALLSYEHAGERSTEHMVEFGPCPECGDPVRFASEDFLQVLADLGVSQVFHSIGVRPGGPTTFGVKDNCLVFCLPGNPVASLIIFAELVRPAILKTRGYRRILEPSVRAILQENASKSPGRIKLLRVRLVSSGSKLLAFSSGDQTTGKLTTLLRADGLAVLPAESTSLLAGEEVEVHMISKYTFMKEEGL